jgi:hypothetical protein
VLVVCTGKDHQLSSAPRSSSVLLLETVKLYTPFIVRVAERVHTCGRTLAGSWTKRAMFFRQASITRAATAVQEQLIRRSSVRDSAPMQPSRPPSSSRSSSLQFECTNSNAGERFTVVCTANFTSSTRIRSRNHSGEMQASLDAVKGISFNNKHTFVTLIQSTTLLICTCCRTQPHRCNARGAPKPQLLREFFPRDRSQTSEEESTAKKACSELNSTRVFHVIS